MASPRDLYQRRHPDQFSDSSVDEVTELDRSLLEFHLSSLTGRSQEHDFETYARHMCERTICPNLLPTTGPTGGGDSKADAETFPVADSLALAWYSGLAREASEERWAFAFSAKIDWRPKVKSDIKKVVETGRGYSKAFFVSNQAIPAKNRSKLEDELKRDLGIEVRILDRTWLLETTFERHLEEIAIKDLKVTGLTNRNVRVGPNDAERLAAISELEKRITSALAGDDPGLTVPDDALEVAELTRELEKPRVEVEGAFGRADRLAEQFGTRRQKVESAYQWAWTLIWWYEDFSELHRQYEIVESRAKDSENGYDVERLSNLWTIVAPRIYGQDSEELRSWLKPRTDILRSALKRLAQDVDRPSISLKAQTSLLFMDLVEYHVRKEDPSETFRSLGQIVGQLEGLVGYPLGPLVEMLSIVGEATEDNEAYNELFDQVIEVAARRDGEITAARLLLRRARTLMNQGRPVKALTICGQALTKLYKNETRDEMIHALLLCGRAYESIGLLWAARGSVLFAASTAANDYWSYQIVKRSLLYAANELKWLELRLGRVPQLMAWQQLESSLRELLRAKGEDLSHIEQMDDAFDGLSARLLIRTPWTKLPATRTLPDVLNGLDMYPAACALLYLLGDVVPLQSECTDMDVSDFANNVWNQNADVSLADEPRLYEAAEEELSTSVLGCQFKVATSTEGPCVEVAESILANLESLLSTSAVRRGFAFEPDVTLEIKVGETGEKFLRMDPRTILGHPHLAITCRDFDPHNLSLEDQKTLSLEISEIAIWTFSSGIRFNDLDADLQNLFGTERATERAQFAGTIGALRNVLGKSPRLRLRDWQSDQATVYPIVRSTPWLPKPKPAEPPSAGATPGVGEPPESLFDPDRISHAQIRTISPIRHALWDAAKWKGAFYMTFPDGQFIPTVGILFEGDRKAGIDIFRDWISQIDPQNPSEEKIRLTFVRGVSQREPHKYRIIVGSNVEFDGSDQGFVQVGAKVHTMEPTSSENLDRFLEALPAHDQVALVPAFFSPSGPQPEMRLAIPVNIKVRQAWEIGENDMDGAGVHLSDDVVVPVGIIDPPVERLKAWKRRMQRDD